MNHLLRAFAVGGIVLVGFLAIAIGLARQDSNLLAPVHLLLFLIGMVCYLIPTALAIYRDCKATVWIAMVNVFLGWTMFGWVVALGWAACAETRPVPPAMQAPPTHPILGH
jgi:hypothetical protein